MIRYADLVNPETPLILGVPLEKFSLGHVLHLHKAKSLFLNQDTLLPQVLADGTTPEELAVIESELRKAIPVCAFSYEDYDALTKGNMETEVETTSIFFPKKAKAIGLPEYLGNWNAHINAMAENGLVNLNQSKNIFQSCMATAFEPIQVQYKNTHDNELGPTSDWTSILMDGLLSEGMAMTKILNQPLRLSMFHFFKIGERNGTLKFLSDVEQDFMALKGGEKPHA